MKTSVFELGNLIQGFKLSCQTEGKSPKTTEWYTSFLERFLQFLKKTNFSTELGQIEKEHIRAFILYLQTEARTPRGEKPLSSATVQGYVRTLKAFFSWVIREEYIESNPMKTIPVPKAPTKIISTLDTNKVGKLIDCCSGSNGLVYRNIAIILLLLDSGLRVSELVNIEIDDVNLEEGYIKITVAKGSKERIVPIGSLVQKTLWKYINHSRPEPVIERITKLFLSDCGISLTRNGVQQMLRRIGRKAGINGVRCSPHTFRHTFAKNYLMNGGDIFSLQKILGHSSLASVRIYLNLFASDIKQQHRRFSPVDNMAENRNIYRFIRQ